jgi:hypothetical protein
MESIKRTWLIFIFLMLFRAPLTYGQPFIGTVRPPIESVFFCLADIRRLTPPHRHRIAVLNSFVMLV